MADMASEGRRSGTNTKGAAEAGSSAVPCNAQGAQGARDAQVIMQHSAAWGTMVAHFRHRCVFLLHFCIFFLVLGAFLFLVSIYLTFCVVRQHFSGAGGDQRDLELELCSIARWSREPICRGPHWQLFDLKGC